MELQKSIHARVGEGKIVIGKHQLTFRSRTVLEIQGGSARSQSCDEDIAHVHSLSGVTYCNFLHQKTMECALLQYPRVDWVPCLKMTLERPRK